MHTTTTTTIATMYRAFKGLHQMGVVELKEVDTCPHS